MQLDSDRLRYYERYAGLVGEALPMFRESLATPLPIALWANPLRTSPEALWRSLVQETGHAPTPIPWLPGAFRWPRGAGRPGLTRAYAAGLFALQEEAAMLPVHLLGPEPGERVLDLCAAPGNKTSQAAVRLRGAGQVVANDHRWARLSPVRRILERLGITNVTATVSNAAIFPERAPPFDAVIADVPCSCDATVRKHPKLRLRQSAERRRRMQGLQRAILRRGLSVCRPGGRVVYATCAFAPEENEAVLDAVLRDPPCDVRVRPVAVPGLRLDPGVLEWQGTRFHPEVHHAIRLWPHRNDTGGFFVALLDRGPSRRRLFGSGAPVRWIPPIRSPLPWASSAEGSPAEVHPAEGSPAEVHPAEGAPAQGSGAEGAPAQGGAPHVRASQRRWAPRWLDARERSDRLAQLCDRFGLPRRAFDAYDLVQPNKRTLALLPRGSGTPGIPPAVFRGVLLLHVNMADPKPTAAAAMILGEQARRNVVLLDAEQATAFLRRDPVTVQAHQLRACTHPGWVLVRASRHILGVARWLHGGPPHVLESHYPKAWSFPRSPTPSPSTTPSSSQPSG